MTRLDWTILKDLKPLIVIISAPHPPTTTIHPNSCFSVPCVVRSKHERTLLASSTLSNESRSEVCPHDFYTDIEVVINVKCTFVFLTSSCVLATLVLLCPLLWRLGGPDWCSGSARISTTGSPRELTTAVASWKTSTVLRNMNDCFLFRFLVEKIKNKVVFPVC